MSSRYDRPIGTLRTPSVITPPIPEWLDRESYPFAHNWAVLPGGTRMHYADEGRGEPVLFVHGTPTWSFEWRHVIRALSPEFRCVAPDLVGFGLSERPRDFAYTPEAHAQMLAAFVDTIGLRNFTLVVHDYGGPIGLPLALDPARRVRRLVILNSWMWSFQHHPDMARRGRLAGSRIFRFLYRRLNFSLRVLVPSAFGDRSKLTKAIHRQYLAPFEDVDARGRVLFPLAKAMLGSTAHYDSLWQQREKLRSIPALILWGMRDPAFRPDQLLRWREAMPHARVVELPSGHWPQEEQPEEIASEMRDFLRGIRVPAR